MLGYEYSTRMLVTKAIIMFLGLIVFIVGLLPILKMTILSDQLAVLPSNPLLYSTLTAFFGLAIIFYAVKHIEY